MSVSAFKHLGDCREQSWVGQAWEAPEGHWGRWVVRTLTILSRGTVCSPFRLAQSSAHVLASPPSISCQIEISRRRNSNPPVGALSVASSMQTKRHSGHFLSDLPSFYYTWSLISLLHSQQDCHSTGAVVQKTQVGTAEDTCVHLCHMLSICLW